MVFEDFSDEEIQKFHEKAKKNKKQKRMCLKERRSSDQLNSRIEF